LLFKQDFRQAPIRLIALDDHRSSRERPFRELYLALGPADFDALRSQRIDDERDARLILPDGNDVAVDRVLLAGVDGIPALLIESFRE
jgi:hypothetical protein